MSDVPTDQANQLNGPGRYEIRVKGHLAARWAAWFDGMTLTPQGDGTTVIHGPVADQSALHGLLRKLNDIGLPLVSVTPTAPDEPPANRATDPVDRPDPADQHPRRSTT
jgi:hypothetical protein